MKNINYGNRGMHLEEFLSYSCERYKMHNLAVIDKQHTAFIPIRNGQGKVVTVKVEKKATVDYMGRYKNIPIAMEAKHTSTDTIRWDAVQEHQADYLDMFTKEPGTIGMVIVSFGLKRFFAIPWAFWGKAYDERVRMHFRGLKPNCVHVEAHGIGWNIPNKKSIRIDEIPPQFEISGNDRTFGLHFLQNADKYITPKVTINS